MNELDLLAVFVHGTITFGNALGVIYNWRRRNWRWMLIHAAGIGAHAYATHQHIKDLQSVR